jgi:hypothetical protein
LSAAIVKQMFNVIWLNRAEDLEEEGSFCLLCGGPVVWHIREPTGQLHCMEPDLFDSQLWPEWDSKMSDLVPFKVQLVFCKDLLEVEKWTGLLPWKVDLLNAKTSRFKDN